MASKVNLPTIDANAAFKHSFFWFSLAPDGETKTPISLTGFNAKLQVRAKKGDTTVLAEWSVANGRITLVDNEVRIFVPASETLTYQWEEGVFDLLIWPIATPEDVTRLVEGNASCSKGVTVL